MTAPLNNGTICQILRRIVPVQRRINAAQALTSPSTAYNLFDVDSVTKLLAAITSARSARCVLNMCAPPDSSAGPTACSFVHMAAVFDDCKSAPDDL